MMRIISWIKKNKPTAIIIVVLLFILYRQYAPGFPLYRRTLYEAPADVSFEAGAPAPKMGLSLLPPPVQEFAPSEREERLVVEESSMSLVVSKVRETSDKIIDYAKETGGFMVSTSLTKPEEVPFATVVVRVPAEKFREVLNYYRSLAVKVSSENIKGTDVTDEYVDIEARLATLNKTKAKFEEIMEEAVEIQDILQVQREIIRLQDQIDTLKGRQNYLEKTAALAKITIYLSTDEFALPYAPSPAFRPGVIFKLSVRSLILNLRNLATLLIWVGVYAVIWVPAAVIIFVVWRWRRRKTV